MRSAISSGFPNRVMPACWGNRDMTSSTVILCAGAHFSKNARRLPVITAPDETLFTCTPSLSPCSANDFDSAGDEILARSFDTGDDQIQALGRAGQGRRDVRAELN